MSKKKFKKRRRLDTTSRDWHHCLFQKRHWHTGWAKRLREHEYCGAMIPKNTLHRFIHEGVNDVPLADGKSCRIAVEAINNWLEAGYIHLDDPLEKKLSTLISIFNKLEPRTTDVLKKQLKIVREFKKASD